MSSPAARPRRPSTPSFLILTEDSTPLPTRSGHLASLLRSRSATSLNNLHRPKSQQDEEAGPRPGWNRDDEEDLGRLLMDEHRLSQILHGPQQRSMSLIGKSNPRYRWDRYWKSDQELAAMSKPIRKYYERTNDLIQQYLYIDRLLDSTIPHELLNEYSAELHASAYRSVDVPDTILEDEPSTSASQSPPIASSPPANGSYGTTMPITSNVNPTPLQKRTPKDIFRSSESLPLLMHADDGEDDHGPVTPTRTATSTPGPKPNLPWLEDADLDSESPIVTLAIWINFIANAILLAAKLVVVIWTPSMSVLASLVDAVLDFLSTAIVWLTTRLILASQSDQFTYPVGRRRLEPVGVLVFSVIMITSFCQVLLECIQRLAGPEHKVLQLGPAAIGIMAGTILIKGAVWLWCRLVKNSSVRALAEDCKTDMVFNFGSILFPIIGFYGHIWWLDATGGLLLSLFVILQWSKTSAHHVRNLTGFSAQPDERNLLLYLTMRFATAIRRIQNLRAYHAGDKLFVEVDIVLDASMPLKDSHDLSEVLTYFLEGVPIVDRAFVHVDYTSYNAPTHMLKQSSSS
ncbi:Metal tolerance protein-like protein [Emericellopsis cladophorae]|uniref:Metal tolerance protein-like protein n=1 Tax=Emericellopsis cladophorae TaxID=2686198 RepID=A0A9P9Y9K7_9HYPO|nr:Metal tolerance protein-like protein [Emericellopsis cladophorae]KAI6785996.1 Metal tolerance protein-like protein [Emericellopsis cladophorae]